MRPLSATKSAVDDLRGDGRGWMLLSVAFGWFLSISVRMIYPALLPHLREAVGLTLTTAGLLLTVLWMAYALGQLPAGILSDWTGERVLLTVSCVLAAGVLGLIVLADSTLVLFAATAAFGLGTAFYGVSRFTVLKRIFPDRLGTATGITMAAGDVGNAVMPPLAGIIAAATAWQYGFGVTIPLFLLAGAALWVTLPGYDGERTSIRGTINLVGVRKTLSQPIIFRGIVLLVLWSVVIQVFLGFYPTYIIDEKGIEPGLATGLFGFFFALGIGLKPLAGRAYDEIGVRVPVLVIAGASGISFVAFPFAGRLSLIVVITVLGATLLGFEPIVISDITRRLPDGTEGINLGVLRTIYIALGATSPVVFGAVADRGFFDEAFLAAAIIPGIIILVCLLWDDW